MKDPMQIIKHDKKANLLNKIELLFIAILSVIALSLSSLHRSLFLIMNNLTEIV
jgi:hypothetical protein